MVPAEVCQLLVVLRRRAQAHLEAQQLYTAQPLLLRAHSTSPYPLGIEGKGTRDNTIIVSSEVTGLGNSPCTDGLTRIDQVRPGAGGGAPDS